MATQQKSSTWWIWLIVGAVGLVILVPLCLVVGGAVAGFMTYRQTAVEVQREAESAAEARRQAEEAQRQAEQEREALEGEAEAARRAAEEAQRAAEQERQRMME